MTGIIENTSVSQPSFLRLVIEDVIVARTQMASDETETARRNVVRTTFAAIEAVLWDTRDHVLTIAKALNTITPLAEMALKEQTYVVNERGGVIEQTRSLTLLTSIRLIEAQAHLIEPALHVRFDHAGWEALRKAQQVRNRITHPKCAGDLSVDQKDLAAVDSGFRWLLVTAEYILAATAQAYRAHNRQHRAVLDALKAGDPEMLAMYEAAVADQE